nr:hypothetical protein [Tanacetum cinerariifolium]
MLAANTTAKTRCLALEAELANLCETNNQDNQKELINHFSKLEVSHLNLQLKYQNLKDKIGNSPPTPDKDALDFDSVFVIGKMQASLQGKDNVTHLQAQNDMFRAENDKIKQHYKELYDSIKIIRAKHIEQVTKLTTENMNLKISVIKATVNPLVSARDKHTIDVEPIVPRLRNNRNAHLDYLRHLKESVETIHDIVKEAKVKAGIYRCQLDEQWFVLTKDTLREALQITPLNNTQAFVAPPSAEVLVDLVNQLGYPRMVKNVSNVVTNDMFQPRRGLTTIINLCLTGKTSGFKRPRAPVLQILWGIVTQSNIDYAERIWEEFTQSIHTFMEDKRNLSRHTTGKKRATLILIPSIRFTKLIIHHLQRRHRFHPRLDYPLHLSNEEPVLGYLKFSAKGFLAGDTWSTQDLPAPKPAKPARKPSISILVASTQPVLTSALAKSQEYKRKQATKTTDKPAKSKRIKRSISHKTCQPRSSPKSVGASEAEEVPAEEPQVADED